MLKGLFILNTDAYEKIYGREELDDISKLAVIYAPQQTVESIRADLGLLHDADVIFSGWGGPQMDEDFLEAAPNLKAVFYGAGSIRGIVTDAFWARDIVITHAAAANAVPVVEYALSQILFCLKRGWHYALSIKREGHFVPKGGVPGAYGSTVGIISLGMIGAGVSERLKDFDVNVIAYDPYASAELARRLDVELCSLEEVFKRADVVSLHTPWLPETVGMITGEHFASMKSNASFINTARGAIVREEEMIAVLAQRPDIYAVLDVTYPEPPVEGSPLYTLPNVVLTPHIAGSMGVECRRMGRYMVEELRRFSKDEPLRWRVTHERFKTMA
jgi:phosphoglycerate dehydrogenase-like enzyme